MLKYFLINYMLFGSEKQSIGTSDTDDTKYVKNNIFLYPRGFISDFFFVKNVFHLSLQQPISTNNNNL